ncbi:MAG TPA: M12 family metallo-peptidase [Thermoanaerobaculia bacterium]|nr:M12 family metallo-peptidase [Thermoanaerobaculia bacterium]
MPLDLKRTIFVFLCLLALPLGSAAMPPDEMPLRAALAGRFVTAPDGEGEAELVDVDPALAPALLDLAPGAARLVADWPVAPGVRQDVELTRFEVYAPDARVVKIQGQRVVELPRSKLAFFHGRPGDDPETRLVVTVDPETGTLEGLALTAEGTRELRPSRAKGTAGSYLIATPEALQPAAEETSWSCGQESQTATHDGLGWLASPLEATTAAAITSLHTVTVAVDTDNELLQLKFGNNTVAATNYIANLIARMNIMYERDFLVRLVQGLTILRPSTTADPYTAGTSTIQGLNEFTTYWSGGCGGACAGVSRGLAMMLSGKASSSNSAAGVAWVGTLCSTSHGYSFTQVFKFAQDTSASDARIVGHELGHNFGSPHTHCYSPPIDTCYNGESCYGGGTSCPAPATYNGVTNVTGTVMSYCHLTGCGSREVFHPRTIELVAPVIQSRVGQCVFPLGLSNAIFSNGFETGNRSAWQ